MMTFSEKYVEGNKVILSIVLKASYRDFHLIGSPKYWEATPTVAPSMQIAHENLQKKVILNVLSI